MGRSQRFLSMPSSLILLFLGLIVQDTLSPEAAGLAKRCDRKSFLTIRTECHACSVNLAAKCPDGYTKITNDSVGVRDCRYKIDCYIFEYFEEMFYTVAALTDIPTNIEQFSFLHIHSIVVGTLEKLA
ncbi:hypothetical protein STEG23_018337 [Scotinomys teguina]